MTEGEIPAMLSIPQITNVTGGIHIDGINGLLTLSTVSLLTNATKSQVVREPACMSTSAPVADCEETPSYLCDTYDGCWVSWGPCQPVSEGFYSPRGTVGQIPCEPIPENERYVEGDALSVCPKICLRDGEVMVEDSCKPVRSGFTAVTDCDNISQLVPCELVYGGLFTEGCQARYLAVALGPPRSASPPFTLQSWVRLNTRALAPNGGIVPVYGLFGSAFIGITAGAEAIRLVLMVATDQFTGYLTSAPLPHINAEWVHIAGAVAEKSAWFFLNGKPVGNSSFSVTARSSPFLLQSLLSESAARQLAPYLNMEHFGPFRLTASDVTGSNFWSGYVLTSYPDMDLFDPNLVNTLVKWCHLSLFEKWPDSASFQNVTVGDCDSESEWNALECDCTLRIVTSTRTPESPTTADPCPLSITASVTLTETAKSTSPGGSVTTTATLDPTTQPSTQPGTCAPLVVEANSNSSTAIGIFVTVLVITAIAIAYFWRKRRVKRITTAPIRPPSLVYPAPESNWYTNVTADWQDYFRN